MAIVSTKPKNCKNCRWHLRQLKLQLLITACDYKLSKLVAVSCVGEKNLGKVYFDLNILIKSRPGRVYIYTYPAIYVCMILKHSLYVRKHRYVKKLETYLELGRHLTTYIQRVFREMEKVSFKMYECFLIANF